MDAADITRTAYRPTRLQLSQTFAYYLAFVALGLSAAVIGPALSTLAAHTGSSLSAISILFTASAAGRLISSLIGARFYDRVTRGHRLIALGLCVLALTLFATPLIAMLVVLVVVELVRGMAETLSDVGGNTLIVWTHGSRVAPYMNGLHFAFGIGAFITPFIIARSLSSGGDVTAGYWVLALLVLPTAAILLRLPSPAPQHHDADGKGGATDLRMLALVSALFFFAVAIEGSYAGWLFNYGAAQGLDNDSAAVLTSTFWGFFTLGRLISIPVSTRLMPRPYVLIDLMGSLVGALMLLLFGSQPGAAWLSVAVAGLAIASLFPTLMSFAEQRMRITGKVTGVFFAAANISAMTVPWLIGQFFETYGAATLPAVMLLSCAAALVVFAALPRGRRSP